MKYSEITYLALDSHGREVQRPVQLIQELPTPEARLIACEEAAQGIAKLIGSPAPSRISFGNPAYFAFGMTIAQAKAHEHAKVLLKAGCEMPLVYCQ